MPKSAIPINELAPVRKNLTVEFKVLLNAEFRGTPSKELGISMWSSRETPNQELLKATHVEIRKPNSFSTPGKDRGTEKRVSFNGELNRNPIQELLKLRKERS